MNSELDREFLEYEAAQERRRLEEFQRWREQKRIPQRVWRIIDSPQSTGAQMAALGFLNSPDTLLVLAGGVGCGKTVAAAWWLDRAPGGGEFTKAITLARAGTFAAEFWDRLTDIPYLVIDDLGAEPLDEKGWMLANFSALVDQRYDSARKTLLTTNLTLEQFKARYCHDGGRLLDRLREVGSFVELAEESRRRAPTPTEAGMKPQGGAEQAEPVEHALAEPAEQ